MQWIHSFDLLLFDLDGLLVDTEELHFRAYCTLCAQSHVEIPWDFSGYTEVAHSSVDGLKTVLAPLLQGKWQDLYKEKCAIYCDLLKQGGISLMPGVEKLLKKLDIAGSKPCVVTHSPKKQVELIKDAIPILTTISSWITREDYTRPKPDPEPYLKAIELFADEGDKIAGFEDSFRGICSLRATHLVLPILICDPSHPQLVKRELEGVIYYPSFEALLSTA